jgi:hypothetical protein
VTEQVVDGDPGVDTLHLAGHYFYAAFLRGNHGEGVDGFEAVADGLQGVVALLWAEFAETCGGFDGDGCASLVFLRYLFKGNLHEDVQTLRGSLSVAIVG